MKKKEKKIIEAIFKAKNRTILEIGVSGNFNGCYMTIRAESIIVIQNNLAEKFMLVDINDNAKK